MDMSVFKLVGQGGKGKVVAAICKLLALGETEFTAYRVAKLAKVSHVTARKALYEMYEKHHIDGTEKQHRAHQIKVVFTAKVEDIENFIYLYDLAYQERVF